MDIAIGVFTIAAALITLWASYLTHLYNKATEQFIRANLLYGAGHGAEAYADEAMACGRAIKAKANRLGGRFFG